VTPTELSLRHLREEGWSADIVERRIPHANITHDWLGVADIIAIKGGETLAVQATSASNVSARVKKIADSPNVAAIREAGIRIEVYGWSHGPDGNRRLRIVDCS
jgi:hypothetical protein